MTNILRCVVLGLSFLVFACHDKTPDGALLSDDATGGKLPPDVTAVVKPLISGHLYQTPGFSGQVIASFDTAVVVYILDTSDAVFAKARIRQDTVLTTGYIPKVILPEYKKN